MHVKGSAESDINGAGARSSFDIINSLIEGPSYTFFATDTAAPGTRIRFVHDTVLLRDHSYLCSNAGSPVPFFSMLFENSIFLAPLGEDAFAAPNTNNCTFTKLMVANQTTAVPGMIVADPKFVDLGARDFRLQSTSPAIDGAVQASINPTTDILGVPRPQGNASDLGAYEFKP